MSTRLCAWLLPPVLFVGSIALSLPTAARSDQCRSGACHTPTTSVSYDYQHHNNKIVLQLFRFHYLDPLDGALHPDAPDAPGKPAVGESEVTPGAGDAEEQDKSKETVIELDDRTIDLIADRVLQKILERGLAKKPSTGPGEVDPNPVTPKTQKKAEPKRTDPPEIAVLRNHCSTCHSGTGAKGGLAMFDDRGQAAQLTRGQWLEISDRVTRDVTDELRMPPGSRGRLDKNELALVKKKTRK